MDSIYESRASSPDNQRKISSSQCRTSSAFRTTARTTKAHWGNRFIKDSNDLTYDVNYSQVQSRTIGSRTPLKKSSKVSGRTSSATI